MCFYKRKFLLNPVYSEKDTKRFTLVNRRSPGFGLTLVAETLNGSFLSAEMSSTPQGQGDPVLPEDLGRNCAKLLLEEVYRVGTTEATRYTHTHTHFSVVVFEVGHQREDDISAWDQVYFVLSYQFKIVYMAVGV